MIKKKSRIISILIVMSMLATGTLPRAFAEAIKENPLSGQTSNTVESDELTSAEECKYITGEIEDLRTEYSKTYEQSDGSRVAVMTASPVHFYDEENKEWQSYDNRLSYDEKTETYESNETGSDMKVSLPKNIDGQSNIEVEKDGYEVSITPIDMKSSASKKVNDKKKIKSDKVKDLKKYDLEDYVSDAVLDGKIEYSQDDDTSIEYIFSGSKLKENIVLSKTPEKKQKYSFRISADGLTAKQKKDNSIKLLDKDKKEVFTIPAPYMYDEGFEFSDNIKTNLKKDGSEYILTYTPDQKWLSDTERKYPVIIDPTIETGHQAGSIIDTSVISSAPLELSDNAHLYAGAGASGKVKIDAYIKFTRLLKIEESWRISNAKLNLKTASNENNKINAYKITSDWQVNNVRENPPTIDSKILDVCDIPSTSEEWVYWDITNTVYEWYNGTANYGIKLSSPYALNNQSEFYSADTDSVEDKPYLSVEYNTISQAQLENSRTLDIGRAGTTTINDFSGNIVLSREDIGIEGNVMPVNISMIYNLQNKDFAIPFNGENLFGYGFKTSYSQTISYENQYNQNKYYEYVCEDGSTVYFDYDEETGDYVDRSDRGYSIDVNGANQTDYENVVITDSNGNNYCFDKYGRLIKIKSSNNEKSEINIVYNGDYYDFYEIDYITDGAGRKYDFNYTNGMLTDISYYGMSSSVLKKVLYDYDSASNLKKVTYSDGKSVIYNWNDHNLISATNTDGYRVSFEYTNYSTNMPQRISSINEYGNRGTNGADISVEYTPYETKYINNNTGDTETLVFSSDGDLISTYNSDGDVTVNEYAKGSNTPHGVNSLVNTYEHKKSETNLVQNGEFETGLEGWTAGNDTNYLWSAIGHPGNDGSVNISGTPGKSNSISQEISISGEKGDTFDIGGWVKSDASPQNELNIAVVFLNGKNLSYADTIDFNPYCTDWQYAMKNEKAVGSFTSIRIVVNYSSQINDAYFDGIVVYKGDKETEENNSEGDTDTDTDTDDQVTEPTTSIGSDGSITTVDENDGVKTITVDDKYGNNLSNETVIGGVTLSDSNTYSTSGNYLKTSTDSSGVKTSYNYNENTGNLKSVKVDSNTVNYGYDAMGNITSASQNVSNLSNGTAITNSYAYDNGDRLSRITHNGFNYDFGYTEFGLLKSINAGDRRLINYGYDSNGILTSANYGNGQTVDYEYNGDGTSAAITQNGTTLYGYNYDEDGVLTSVNDNESGRVTNYLTNDDGEDIIEETGNGIYHKLNSRENEKEETIGDQTKITKTTEEDNLSKTSYKVDYIYDSIQEKNTDKFGRTSKEHIYRTGKAGNTQNIYDKEYSYYSAGSGKTSERVSQVTYTGDYDKTIKYEYDDCGNISKMNNIIYVYDEAGQLTREFNPLPMEGKDYIYDKGGNITEVRHIYHGRYEETDTYTYGNSEWKDLLTAYNGNEITYDEIGNPLTYYNGMEFKWTMGRRLESVKNGNTNVRYTYNADGLRTSKTVNNVKYNYYWNGDKLTGQTWQGNTLYFYYDKDGNPIGFDLNNNNYYYVTNLQGDIIAILSPSNGLLAEYEYDAWGNCTVLYDTNDIADINPLRYRGYYYDTDTNLYYLQSRYYDSNIGRFINADDFNIVQHGDENLFSYTFNNYIMFNDTYGTAGQTIKPAPSQGVTELGVVEFAIKASGLTKRRYSTIYFFSGKRKEKNGSIKYTFTSSKKYIFYKTDYYVIKKTRKQWLKYIKNKYGKLKKVNDFFTKLEEYLGDPLWNTEPSVSELASALNKVAKIISWATIPREAKYIVDMIRKYDNSKDKKIRKQKQIYIPYSAHVYQGVVGKKYIFFGPKILKYHYNHWEYAW